MIWSSWKRSSCRKRKAIKGITIWASFCMGCSRTALGTFDGFMKVVEEQPTGLDVRHHKLHYVGWPHYTLASIDDNAEDLMELMDEKWVPAPIPS